VREIAVMARRLKFFYGEKKGEMQVGQKGNCRCKDGWESRRDGGEVSDQSQVTSKSRKNIVALGYGDVVSCKDGLDLWTQSQEVKAGRHNTGAVNEGRGLVAVGDSIV